MMMHLLNKKYAGMETDFNWGKYAFNQFLKHVEAFEPKIVEGLAEPKVNMHFGLRIFYLQKVVRLSESWGLSRSSFF